jgi:type III restriction enzyme
MSGDSATDNRFFTEPIRNSPYEYPREHWELDVQGQPTQRIIEGRRRAEFITPIPKPRKRKGRVIKAALSSTKARGFQPRSSSTTLLRSSMSFATR